MQEESGHFVSFMSFALEKMGRLDKESRLWSESMTYTSQPTSAGPSVQIPCAQEEP